MATQTATSALFLDFDGVLHPDQVYWSKRRGIYLDAPGHSLFEWVPLLEQLLAPHPSVAIVLATTWVRIFSYDFARKCLSPALRERIIGATYHKRHMNPDGFASLSRGAQVIGDIRRRKPKNWLAVDDDDEGWPASAQANFIKTDGALGISAPDVQLAIRAWLEGL